MEDRLNELLELERAGWRSLCDRTGADFYGSLMTEDGRMVLANGVVMSRSAVIDSLADAPPWSSYTIDDPVVTTLSDDVAALVYTGTGHRDGGEDFTGIMTSVYVRYDSGWKLAHYQQTPKP
jgi:hypothetical protein